MTVEEYINGVKNGDRVVLAQAITLIESNSLNHFNLGQKVLRSLLPLTGNSIRIAITGSPGVGKSTFINSFGTYLCNEGHKVAVLAIDPSSIRSRGSVLGDKTRMEDLANNDNAYIRPSPSAGTLGGVNRKTRETMLLCEAAGFDTILVETVGVGQSEVTARSMTDFFLLLLQPGAGDELQGIKKGAVELADGILINKADGSNLNMANLTKAQYQNALHYILPATDGWQTPVLLASSIEEKGLEDVWSCIKDFIENTTKSKVFSTRRNEQKLDWLNSMIDEYLKNRFFNSERIKNIIPSIETSIINGAITPSAAIQLLIKEYEQNDIAARNK
ncbi:MAG TPA: methylmalonyl Co-A mutase-associated GTPase MeaB [Candidatus Kapabacteria bacterium]|nr:methylmalonyl Co-A mutase-associated GTPase MeaB [Candidatus Kapabacteria bacterium]HPO62222.1 methylmalonyl Co-A mutase-associated GTPase MeaB [Candidatus Kapabacteria bacterium]